MMNAIGGYFEKEPRTIEEHALPQLEGILLNTGRNAFEYILRSIPNLRGVYLPFYTCNVMLEPLKRLFGVSFAFYHVSHHLEMVEDIKLGEGEYIVINNYFGIKDEYVQKMANKYKDRLIVDNAQAFYAPVLDGIKSFYSTRKFFGVPDGGIACVPVDDQSWLNYDNDNSVDRLEHLTIRAEQGPEAGYSKFREAEDSLDNQSIMQMSSYTRDALQHIDYVAVQAKRRENFQMLHEALYKYNALPIPNLDSFACPMVYPFMDCRKRKLRLSLKEQRVYVSKYWPNVASLGHFNFEEELAEYILPLPNDQRYNVDDMHRIINLIRT